ncbi:MAG: alpha/beta hydrolase [Pseudanabaena sp.]|nr:MAG: alpha/beta hydrolase [Pseudanabaena sp.]
MKLTQSFVSLFALSLVLFNGSSVAQASGLKSSIPIDSITMQATNFKSGANRVTFESEGEKMVGVLYLPKSYKSGDKLPTVIVTGAWMTIKEQMPSIYAQKLADRGYAAFAFDFRTWGESGGKLRDFESPSAKIADIKNAVSFLQTVDAVDPYRIAGLGICASAGYMVVAAAEDSRIKSLVTVAPWIHDPQIVEAVYGGKATVQKLITTGKTAKEKFKQTDKADYVLATSKTDKTAVMFGDIDYYQNPKRGAIPQWSNQFALASWSEWLTFNPMPVAKQIKVPTLFIHSEKAAIPDGARQFFAAIPIKNKQINWLSDRSQFDFYDQEATVNQSVSLIADRLKTTL